MGKECSSFQINTSDAPYESNWCIILQKTGGIHVRPGFKDFQENYRFWNPNPLGLGGKTALVNETKRLKKQLTLV
jgi:hypothetical protein